jgi:SAM-dependent methyltransferase
MDILFASLSVRPADVLVDVGCGKGRATNWFLSRYPKNRIIGIELDPEVCARTRRRLKRYRNVSIICDEVTAAIPANGTVFYLFNPFDDVVMRRFRDALVSARSAAPIGTTVVYYNSKFLDVFSEDPRFSVAAVSDPRLPAQSAIITMR